jgi:5-methylphenazine-1-carboxylate 1-monooxygenase
LEVALIGGGIGGLATALYLHRESIRSVVYEAAPSFSQLGVGINLMPHAIRALGELGLIEALEKVAVEPRERCFYSRHGQLIYKDFLGRHAGYEWPHFSIHRGDLHGAMLSAVRERLGPDAIRYGHRCIRIEQDDKSVTLHLEDPSGHLLGTASAAVAIGCDGVHSTVRRQFYPDETELVFGGINMWRGSTTYRPILGGASVILAGPLEAGKLVIYPMRNHADGTQLINWNVEVHSEVAGPNNWNKNGRIEDFIWRYEDDHFDWLDIKDLFRKADMILEYPMVDRDPIPRWSFGRVTLLGDAAHPMYPRSGNGAAQSIIDGKVLAGLLAKMAPDAALAAYEKERLERVNAIVVSSRSSPPDLIIETVERMTQGKRFNKLEDVISRQELERIADAFHRLVGGDKASVNLQGSS